MRAAGAECEDQQRRKVTKKILPQGESDGWRFAVFRARRLPVKAPGEFHALARSGRPTSCWARPGSLRLCEALEIVGRRRPGFGHRVNGYQRRSADGGCVPPSAHSGPI
jgi:hypothetical protein